MIRDFHVELLQGWPWWGVFLLTVAIAASVVLFYRRVSGRVPRRHLILLMALRCMAMLALLLCLFRPTIRYQRGMSMRPTLLVMADTSKSMSIRDFAGQPGRFERMAQILARKEGAAAEVAENFEVEWYAFSRHARRVRHRTHYKGLVADGNATDIVASVKDALGEARSSEIGGVVLLTDGIHTTVEDPKEDLLKMDVPVFAVGVGSILEQSEDYRDIAVARVDADREMAVKTTLSIVAHIEVTGFRDRVVPVLLREDGVEVAREQVVLDNAPGVQKVTLRYTPQNKGDFELTVEAPADASERVTENNIYAVPIWVTDPRIRVLYVEGAPRSEYKYLRRILELDPQIEVLSLVRIAANKFLMQGNIKDIQLSTFPQKYDGLQAFKVLIIGSLPSETFSKEQLAFIKKFVSEGGGLMMLGGEHSFGPGGYGGTPVEEVLPVEMGGIAIGQERESFQLTLTAPGRIHPIFAGLEEFFAVVQVRETGKVSDLRGCVRMLRAKPLAEVLAIHPRRRNDHGPLVAVVAGRFGGGRTVAATIDTTWEWYAPMRGLGKQSPYVRYWGQAVRWLADVEETRRAEGAHVSAFPDKHYYEPGMRPQLNARVSNAEGLATDRARVRAVCTPLGGDGKPKQDAVETVQLSPVTGSPGDYSVELAALESSKYQVVVSATLDGDKLGEVTLGFRVGEPTREFERLDLNEDLLREIASKTGGQYLPLLSFNHLLEVIRSKQEEKIEKVEIFLWNSPMLFVAFLLFISAEWILRKRRLLS